MKPNIDPNPAKDYDYEVNDVFSSTARAWRDQYIKVDQLLYDLLPLATQFVWHEERTAISHPTRIYSF